MPDRPNAESSQETAVDCSGLKSVVTGRVIELLSSASATTNLLFLVLILSELMISPFAGLLDTPEFVSPNVFWLGWFACVVFDLVIAIISARIPPSRLSGLQIAFGFLFCCVSSWLLVTSFDRRLELEAIAAFFVGAGFMLMGFTRVLVGFLRRHSR